MMRVRSIAPIAASAAVIALAAGPGHATGQELAPVAERIAQAWGRNDVARIAALVASTGVSVELVAGERVGPLPPDQAAAVLRTLFSERETVSSHSALVRDTGGNPRRGFLELAWTSRARGTSEPETSTVFLAMVVETGEWRITEIRHIR